MESVMKITAEKREFLERTPRLLATSDLSGRPNVAVKGSLIVIDGNTLAFAEASGGRTYRNIQENPRVMVVAADFARMEGYRIVGEAKLVTEGKIYEQLAGAFERMGRPKPKAAAEIRVTEVYDLRGNRA